MCVGRERESARGGVACMHLTLAFLLDLKSAVSGETRATQESLHSEATRGVDAPTDDAQRRKGKEKQQQQQKNALKQQHLTLMFHLSFL